MLPNTMKHTKIWVYGPMWWIRCVRFKKLHRDFVARTFALIEPVQYVLQQVSWSYETIPNAPKYCETDRNTLELWAPWSLDNPRSKLLFQMLWLEASLSQNFQNNFFSSEFINGLKIVLSWERHGYIPTLYICYGESALAYKDCRCGYHLAFLSCNHMSDLGWTWSRTHRLRAAIHLEAGCNGYQERTGDLCGVPCRELNYISFSCVLLGPWLFRGGCGLYVLCVYEIKLYLT